MDLSSFVRRDISGIRKDILPLSGFGILSHALADEIAARNQAREGYFYTTDMEFLEEGEPEQQPMLPPVPRKPETVRMDMNILFKIVQESGENGKALPAGTRKMLERVRTILKANPQSRPMSAPQTVQQRNIPLTQSTRSTPAMPSARSVPSVSSVSSAQAVRAAQPVSPMPRQWSTAQPLPRDRMQNPLRDPKAPLTVERLHTPTHEVPRASDHAMLFSDVLHRAQDSGLTFAPRQGQGGVPASAQTRAAYTTQALRQAKAEQQAAEVRSAPAWQRTALKEASQSPSGAAGASWRFDETARNGDAVGAMAAMTAPRYPETELNFVQEAALQEGAEMPIPMVPHPNAESIRAMQEASAKTLTETVRAALKEAAPLMTAPTATATRNAPTVQNAQAMQTTPTGNAGQTVARPGQSKAAQQEMQKQAEQAAQKTAARTVQSAPAAPAVRPARTESPVQTAGRPGQQTEPQQGGQMAAPASQSGTVPQARQADQSTGTSRTQQVKRNIPPRSNSMVENQAKENRAERIKSAENVGKAAEMPAGTAAEHAAGTTETPARNRIPALTGDRAFAQTPEEAADILRRMAAPRYPETELNFVQEAAPQDGAEMPISTVQHPGAESIRAMQEASAKALTDTVRSALKEAAPLMTAPAVTTAARNAQSAQNTQAMQSAPAGNAGRNVAHPGQGKAALQEMQKQAEQNVQKTAARTVQSAPAATAMRPTRAESSTQIAGRPGQQTEPQQGGQMAAPVSQSDTVPQVRKADQSTGTPRIQQAGRSISPQTGSMVENRAESIKGAENAGKAAEMPAGTAAEHAAGTTEIPTAKSEQQSRKTANRPTEISADSVDAKYPEALEKMPARPAGKSGQMPPSQTADAEANVEAEGAVSPAAKRTNAETMAGEAAMAGERIPALTGDRVFAQTPEEAENILRWMTAPRYPEAELNFVQEEAPQEGAEMPIPTAQHPNAESIRAVQEASAKALTETVRAALKEAAPLMTAPAATTAARNAPTAQSTQAVQRMRVTRDTPSAQNTRAVRSLLAENAGQTAAPYPGQSKAALQEMQKQAEQAARETVAQTLSETAARQTMQTAQTRTAQATAQPGEKERLRAGHPAFRQETAEAAREFVGTMENRVPAPQTIGVLPGEPGTAYPLDEVETRLPPLSGGQTIPGQLTGQNAGQMPGQLNGQAGGMERAVELLRQNGYGAPQLEYRMEDAGPEAPQMPQTPELSRQAGAAAEKSLLWLGEKVAANAARELSRMQRTMQNQSIRSGSASSAGSVVQRNQKAQPGSASTSGQMSQKGLSGSVSTAGQWNRQGRPGQPGNAGSTGSAGNLADMQSAGNRSQPGGAFQTVSHPASQRADWMGYRPIEMAHPAAQTPGWTAAWPMGIPAEAQWRPGGQAAPAVVSPAEMPHLMYQTGQTEGGETPFAPAGSSAKSALPQLGTSFEAQSAYPALSMEYSSPMSRMEQQLQSAVAQQMSAASRPMGMQTEAGQYMAGKAAPGGMTTLDQMSAPPVNDQIVWQNPYLRSAPADMTYRNKKKPPEQPQPAPRPQTVRMSDAEIHRMADQVFRIVKDKIRQERRKMGL